MQYTVGWLSTKDLICPAIKPAAGRRREGFIARKYPKERYEFIFSHQLWDKQ